MAPLAGVITADKRPLGEKLVTWMVRWQLHGFFHRIYWDLPAPLPVIDTSLPVIFYSNHTSWWDGYLTERVVHTLGLDGYLMMDRRQLEKYFFFRWMGCFSVDLENPRAAVASLRYISGVLQAAPGRALWIFPQGEIRHVDQRPLGFQTGLAHLVRLLATAWLTPVALRFEIGVEQFPVAYVKIGAPARLEWAGENRRQLTEKMEREVTRLLDQMHQELTAADLGRYQVLMEGRISVHHRFDSWSDRIRRAKIWPIRLRR